MWAPLVVLLVHGSSSPSTTTRVLDGRPAGRRGQLSRGPRPHAVDRNTVADLLLGQGGAHAHVSALSHCTNLLAVELKRLDRLLVELDRQLVRKAVAHAQAALRHAYPDRLRLLPEAVEMPNVLVSGWAPAAPDLWS